MKKEIMWNNEAWIIDYGERVIYKKVRIETGMLPINASIRYPFRNFKDVIYFQKGNDFYKIVDDKVTIMIKEEADRVIDLYIAALEGARTDTVDPFRINPTTGNTEENLWGINKVLNEVQ